MTTLYDTDFYLWTQEQAALLARRDADAVDWEHLAEEVMDMGASQYAAVSSAVYQILVHLLKWRYQPAKRSRSWQVSLVEHRARIPRRLRRMPSLARELPTMMAEEYPAACRKASVQTGLPLATFSPSCPWTPEEVLDGDFWPEAEPERPRDRPLRAVDFDA
jgi:hypothetical protein